MTQEGVGHILRQHLDSFPTAPYLFVGSGISRRFLGLEDWNGLLEKYARSTERPYEYFLSSAGGNLPLTASLLADAFHDVWWSDGAYKSSRRDNEKALIDRSSALKVEISRYLLESSIPDELGDAEQFELALLKDVVVDGVVTTNWDLLIEGIFPEYRVFIGQDELLFSDPQGVGEVYKIHGCATKPQSLVLTADDYERFNDRNPYLAAKLLSVFVEHPVIFLGYSLADANVKAVLTSISKCLTKENVGQLQDRLIFVQWDDSLEGGQVSRSSFLADDVLLPIMDVRVPDFVDVFRALGAGRRRFPARLLRQLKEHVYDLVRTQDPAGRLTVAVDIDDDTSLEDVEVVFGVGLPGSDPDRVSESGYAALDRDDLIRDILTDQGYDAALVVEHVLPRLLRSAKYVPVWKYLKVAGHLNEVGSLKSSESVDGRLATHAMTDEQFFAPPEYYRKRAEVRGYLDLMLPELVEAEGDNAPLFYGALVPAERVDTAWLEGYLNRQYSLLGSGNTLEVTQYIKLLCFFDYLSHRMPIE
jgi:hypothetical protein